MIEFLLNSSGEKIVKTHALFDLVYRISRARLCLQSLQSQDVVNLRNIRVLFVFNVCEAWKN